MQKLSPAAIALLNMLAEQMGGLKQPAVQYARPAQQRCNGRVVLVDSSLRNDAVTGKCGSSIGGRKVYCSDRCVAQDATGVVGPVRRARGHVEEADVAQHSRYIGGPVDSLPRVVSVVGTGQVVADEFTGKLTIGPERAKRNGSGTTHDVILRANKAVESFTMNAGQLERLLGGKGTRVYVGGRCYLLTVAR